MRVIALNYSGCDPWDLEAQAADRVGAAFEVLSYDDFRDCPRECDVIVNAGGWPLSDDLLEQVHGCRFILGFGVGLDWIDLNRAAARGIMIGNTPLANVEDVATHAMALLLACTRRLVEFDRRVRSGRFDRRGVGSMHRLNGRRLGLLSYGNIPRRLRELARPFGLSVAAWDPYVPADVMRSHDVEPMDLGSLLKTSDILSVHTPATGETLGLVNEERLRLLPQGAIVIITSRGAVYDSEAVALLLQEGHLAGAGLDVFPDEPLRSDDPLLGIPTVVLTPHVGGRSEEANAAYHSAAVAAVTALAEGRMPAGKVDPTGRVLAVAP